MPNLFENLPADLSDEVFESIVDSDNVHIERIVSLGHRSPETGWYDQESNEWVLVVKGQAVLEFESGEEARLGQGDYILFKPHQKHRVKWTQPDTETIWLAIHF